MNLLSTAHAEMLAVLTSDHRAPAGRSDAWHRVGSPVVLDADVLDRDLAAIVRLCTLVDRLPELACGGDRTAYLRHLGLPAALDDLVVGGDMPGDFFARPDCVLHDGRLRVLELNIGTGTVNLAAAMATALYLAGSVQPTVHGRLGGRWVLEDWAADRQYAKVLAELGGGGPVGLWYHDASADGRRLTEDMCAVVAAHDIDAVPVHTDEVPTCDLPLYACFSTVHLLGRTGSHLAAIVRAALDRRVACAVRPGDLRRTAKANLALLHRLASRGQLSDEDADVVVRHVPVTHFGTEATTVRRIRTHKDDWIIKPNVSFQAHGIVFGRETSQRHWEELLDRGFDGVVQEVVDSDPVPLLVHEPDGSRIRRDGRFVFMPHILGGTPCGVSVRYSVTRHVLGRIDFSSTFSTLCLTARRRRRAAEHGSDLKGRTS